MTPQEEKLVLELHSQWGNRWSRIARSLPGRTDNEIKNYWRTHMRKKAQERKRAMSPSSPSSNYSSSSSNNEPSDSKGITDTTTGSSHGAGSRNIFAVQEKNSEQEEAYSMDDIWKDITSSEEPIKPMCEVRSNFSCPPIASPLWEYCPDPLWKMDDEGSKTFSAINDPIVPSYGP